MEGSFCKFRLAMGLISGTSMDGIDVCIIKINISDSSRDDILGTRYKFLYINL